MEFEAYTIYIVVVLGGLGAFPQENFQILEALRAYLQKEMYKGTVLLE